MSTGRGRGTTTQRGLGWQHQQQREALLRRLVPGTPCWWCGQGLYPEQGLHADHSIPRSQGGTRADRLVHKSCNLERGDGRNDWRRPALTGKPVNDRKQVPVDLGKLSMPWP